MQIVHNPPAPSTSSAPATILAASSTKPATTAAPLTSTSVVVVVPTPVAQTCPTTGVYTFPATTVTLTETTTVIAASTTAVPSGTHTLGGVTTVVTTATTVTCPYATVSTSEGVTTSVIKTTTYECPSAGTYTIAPTTVTATKDTTVVVPVVSTYCPGTYTQPELVTTITETSTVVYCPFDIPVTTTVSLTTPVATSSAATTPAATTAYPTSTAVAISYPVASASKTSSSATSKPTGSLTGNGSAPWAITYTPYDSNGQCKTADAVKTDIAAIAASGVTAVRVYSTDCDTLPNVGGACADHGLRIILGIFIDQVGCTAKHPTVEAQISAIKEWANWDIVDLIVVANEAIFNGYCTPSELASLISECKSEFSGYTGYFTTTDTVNIWQQSTTTDALCDVIDIVGAQAHAYFNTETVAADAGKFVRGQLDIVNAVCPGKEARVLETGWPSAGICNGKACAGTAEQAEAIASLLSEVSQESVFFSLTDDEWKDGNTDCKCEQHWGCSSALGLSGLTS
ncbi:glycoside hydrolase superfamily [Truncatella angustata]|uniref:Probable beta-glucosidase btgE n=1 Tax=Truncatella angustata TaxID=152316 RepID=A0A9P8ZUV1_9PEZI|nr:glycoside hydrolase superfamily [Truncatella angustata]KAH6648488.1 glycoside hydrolase superfamily [Truncatella angustata]